jgi:hypothetical protein
MSRQAVRAGCSQEARNTPAGHNETVPADTADDRCASADRACQLHPPGPLATRGWRPDHPTTCSGSAAPFPSDLLPVYELQASNTLEHCLSRLTVTASTRKRRIIGCSACGVWGSRHHLTASGSASRIKASRRALPGARLDRSHACLDARGQEQQARVLESPSVGGCAISAVKLRRP